MPKKYVVNWGIPSGSEFSEPMTAKELTDFLNNAPHDKTFGVRTFEEVLFTISKTGYLGWGNQELVDKFMDDMQSWDEHRL